jgi:TolB-like protein/Tfp pilus assembly protein PilF
VKPHRVCNHLDAVQPFAPSDVVPTPASAVFRIGSFVLDADRRLLMHEGHPVSLGSRAYDLLLALVRRRGELVTKDELIAAVWSGTVVDENNLAAQISALRKVLAADPEIARDLQTVPGRGYRFVAKIEGGDGRAVPQAAPPDARDMASLVVLPFASLSSDAEQAYFARGLSQTISTDLSRISGLLVISSATAATFEGKTLDVRHVSKDLGVRYVLTGNVHRIDRQVRINAQLVDGRTGVQIWSELFDGDASDLFSLQDRITGRIANSIGREIFVAAARDGEASAIDPKSSDLVMLGIAADNKPQSLETLRTQEALFARAAALDPTNGEALARLARAIVIQVTQAHASTDAITDALARGREAAEKALAIDPGNARAHYAMGLVHVLRGDYERSALANEAAITLDRNFALAHNNLGNSLLHLGKGHEALASAETALRLDPRGPQRAASWTVMGFAHLLLGEPQEAVACFSRSRTANPRLPRAHAGAAIALALSGDESAARNAAADLLALVPHYRLSQTIDARLPNSPPAYRQFYERTLLPGATIAGIPI